MLPMAVALPADAKATVGIRSEHLRLADPAMPHSLVGSVATIEYLGSDTLVHVDVPSDGNQRATRLIARATESHINGLAVGSHVKLHIDVERALVFSEDGRRIDPTAVRSELSRQFHYA